MLSDSFMRLRMCFLPAGDSTHSRTHLRKSRTDCSTFRPAPGLRPPLFGLGPPLGMLYPLLKIQQSRLFPLASHRPIETRENATMTGRLGFASSRERVSSRPSAVPILPQGRNASREAHED